MVYEGYTQTHEAMFWILFSVIALQTTLLRETFDAKRASALEVNIARGDVVLHTAPDVDEVLVEVTGMADDWEVLDRVYRKLDFDVVLVGNQIRLTTRKPERLWRFWEWFRERDVQFEIQVILPEHYAVNVRTSGGDIEAGIHRHNTRLRTSGGDISYSLIEAPETILLQTAGGDIEGGTLRAPEVTVTTSGGDIELGDVEGAYLTVSTAGGDIHVNAWSGTGEIRTVGGDILVRGVEGDLEASTSGGDIEVYLRKPGTIRLRTVGGDIEIWAPADLKASVDLSGGRVRIARAFSFTGDIERDEAVGVLNEGGEATLVARTVGGTVTLRPLVLEE